MIHDKADVQTTRIGSNTTVWQYAIILPGAVIGDHCNINCHTFIENDVKIGDRVTVKSGVYVWDGIELEDDVFVGPNVTFVNDKFPKSKRPPESFMRTHIGKGASIGAASVILGGVRIGRYAMIGAGSVVTKDVPDHALVYGNPAIVKGKVDENGSITEKY